MNTAKFLTKVEGLATLERPRYSPGLLLEDTDLTAGVDYTREMTRLLFRSLFGCGVICGLDVKATLKCKRTQLHVEVASGLALDGSGNPLQVVKTQQIKYDPDCLPMPPVVWVVLCYKDKACRPKDVSCSGEGDRAEHTRSRDGFVIMLYDGRPDCACACTKPELGTPGRRLGRCCHDDEEDEVPATRRMSARERPLAPMAPMVAMPATPTPAAPTPAAPIPAEPSSMPRPKVPDVCACYEDHNAGKCVPDCGCSCVVLARIDTTPTKTGEDDVEVTADERVRRRIRPVLTGYLECLEPVRPEEPGPTPPPPTPGLTVTCHLGDTVVVVPGSVDVEARVSNAAPGAITYAWSTSRGTISGTGQRVKLATEGVTPGGQGEATITVQATDSAGKTARSTCSVAIEFIG